MKKWIAVTLIVFMAAALFAACSDAPAQNSAPAESAAAESSAPADDTAAESSAPAQSPDKAVSEPSADASGAEGKTVGIVIYASEIPFASDLGASAVKTAQENGMNFVYLDGQMDMTTQQLGVEDWLATNSIDALIIESVDSEGARVLMEECQEADIPVVAADTRPNSDIPIAVVQSDNFDIGKKSAQAALEQLKEKNGDYKGTIISVAFDETESMFQRNEGFKSVIEEYPDIEIVDYQAQSSSVTDAQSLCDDILVAYPDGAIDVIFCVNSALANGVIASQESAGRTDFVIIGVDDDAEELAALTRDTSTFVQTIAQEPQSMGKDAV